MGPEHVRGLVLDPPYFRPSWPGRIGQWEVQKGAIGPKGPNFVFLGVGKGPIKNPSRPISAGKGQPRGGQTAAIGPKGPNLVFLRVGKGPIQKPSRPISAGKDQPRGGQTGATGPKGANCFFSGSTRGRFKTTASPGVFFKPRLADRIKVEPAIFFRSPG